MAPASDDEGVGGVARLPITPANRSEAGAFRTTRGGGGKIEIGAGRLPGQGGTSNPP